MVISHLSILFQQKRMHKILYRILAFWIRLLSLEFHSKSGVFNEFFVALPFILIFKYENWVKSVNQSKWHDSSWPQNLLSSKISQEYSFFFNVCGYNKT